MVEAIVDTDLALGIDQHDVGVGAGNQRPLSGSEPEDLRRVRGADARQVLEGDPSPFTPTCRPAGGCCG
jgi:hypothetical protein